MRSAGGAGSTKADNRSLVRLLNGGEVLYNRGMTIFEDRARNVLGGPLEECSRSPITGFYRDGCCNTGPQDRGVHAVCAQMTADFLMFSRAAGNDLSRARPEYGFPGLAPGDCWCLCASRWQEALEAGMAPPVKLAGTHERALDFVKLEDLLAHATDQGADQGADQGSDRLPD